MAALVNPICEKHQTDKLIYFRSDRHSWVSHCRECSRERSHKLCASGYVRPYDAKKNRTIQLKSKFGLSLEDFDRKLRAQNGVCAICRKPESAKRKQQLSVDHDHETGAVRKLLCSRCNAALGSLREDFDAAVRLAQYIQEFKGVI